MTTYQNDPLGDLIDVDQPTLMTGMLNEPDSVESAYKALHEKDYKTEDINVVMSDEPLKIPYSQRGETEVGTNTLSAAGTGSVIDGTIGGLISSGLPEARAKI